MINVKTGLLALAAFIVNGNGYAVASVDEAAKYGPCTLPIVVKGTVVAEGKPEWSQAQILDKGSKKNSRTITLKKPWVEPGAKLIEIGEGFITLEVGKNKTLQRCFKEAHVFTGPSSEPAKKPVSVKADLSEVDPNAPKAKLKGVIDLFTTYPMAGDTSRPASLGYWANGTKAAHGTAFQVLGFKKNSELWNLGLRPWDVVKKLNGESFVDPRNAEKLFQQMSNDTEKLIFQVMRRGKIVEVEYSP